MVAMSDRQQSQVDIEGEPFGIGGSVPVPLFGTSDQIGRIALPAPVTRFVGRTREVPLLSTLILSEDVRLISLTGPGGVGKTRLALQAAREVATEFLDGAVFVPLAAV